MGQWPGEKLELDQGLLVSLARQKLVQGRTQEELNQQETPDLTQKAPQLLPTGLQAVLLRACGSKGREFPQMASEVNCP